MIRVLAVNPGQRLGPTSSPTFANLSLTGNLAVAGAVTFAATVTATGQFLATAGTDGAPGYAFAGGTTVGMRLGAADSLRFVGGGAVFAVMDANGITTALNGTFTGYVQASSFLTSGGYGRFGAPSDGVVVLSGASTTDFGRLCFGGTTSAFPAIKRSGSALHVRLADDSAYADLNVENLNATVNVIASNAVWASNGGNLAGFTCYGSGKARWTDAGGSDFDIMVFGSATDAYPALKRSGATLVVRLGDDSGNGNLAAANIAATGYLLSNTVYDVNSVKILGAQGAAVADATGAGDVVAQLNTLLARVRAHGLIAT